MRNNVQIEQMRLTDKAALLDFLREAYAKTLGGAIGVSGIGIFWKIPLSSWIIRPFGWRKAANDLPDSSRQFQAMRYAGKTICLVIATALNKSNGCERQTTGFAIHAINYAGTFSSSFRKANQLLP